ncbi:MAG TPA: TIGR00730 family Rossman fold protein, partial [Spirochaetota bacterium]|nr:TIGR00730 family Rossman fold protein [Spirochaetota bacterium]
MKTICVYCGSSPGHDGIYRREAIRMGEMFAREGIALVYGGGRVGLMGIIADTVISNGGNVIGVIPKFMDDRELSHNGVTELILVETMHERKKTMADRADGFIAMPGGVGTYEEIFEAITWSQLKLHD